jgi:predicted SprT family Zn-dependent metalloprotease
MKLRWKILLVILAAVAFHLLEQHLSPCSAVSLSTRELQTTYSEFNTMYFSDSLPANTAIDYGEYNIEYAATTTVLPDGRFHIAMNEKYVGAARFARVTILHEQCHVKTWNTEREEHGKRWRACMLQLDMQGAFREQIIDGYQERFQ